MGMLWRRHKLNETAKKAVSDIPTENVENVESETETKVYSKSEIQTMNTANLQALAKELGIENADETSGNKLKPLIIEKLGL